MSRRHLAELSVKDLALVSDLRLELSPGLTILTGETGAGKSMLVDALVAATGGRVSAAMIRDGADRARVEAVFAGDGDDDLVLSREIAEGRSPARVDDRSVPVARLAEAGAGLVAVHGQHEQIRLASPRTQRALLDAFGAHAAQRDAVRVSHERLSALDRERDALGGDPRERARHVELLAHQLDEIRGAAISADEEERLASSLAVARSAERLQEHARAALEQLSGDRAALAARELAQAAGIDARVAPLSERVAAALEELRDVATELRRYADGLDADPRELAALEGRSDLLRGLRRRYGDTLAEVLAFAEQAAAELDELSRREERLAAIDAERGAAHAGLLDAARALTDARRSAGARLAAAVERELAELGLARCRFSVELAAREPDATGGDEVRFLIAPNPGEPPAPLGEVASGGELSRIMLAIEVTLAAQDDVPVLVFDEVDSGVGGRLGEVVGRKLWTLARDHQVLCVSHLPQVAAYADRHVRVRKEIRRGRTHVIAEALGTEARLEELGAMLGTGGRPRELVKAANDWRKA